MSYKPWKLKVKEQRTIPDKYKVDNYVQKIPTNLSLDLNDQVTIKWIIQYSVFYAPEGDIIVNHPVCPSVCQCVLYVMSTQ